jgi:class 3 adenylate cyclase
VTCAFSDPQQAFGAARYIQAGLVELNAFRNKIGVPIRLRAGIHTGTVVSPSTEDITKISFAHVIDVAAHMQKSCPPGGIALSEEAARRIQGGVASVSGSQIDVQGIKGYVWQPRSLSAAQDAVPPPTPPVASQPEFDCGLQEESNQHT